MECKVCGDEVSNSDYCYECRHKIAIDNNKSFIRDKLIDSEIWFYDEIKKDMSYHKVEGDLLARLIEELIPDVGPINAHVIEIDGKWDDYGALVLSKFTIAEVKYRIKRHYT